MHTTYKTVFHTFLFLILLFPASLFAQEDSGTDSVLVRESVYLHIGKTQYRAGESLYFNAFVRSPEGLPVYENRNLYVELLNPNGYAVYRKRLFIDNEGSASGFFALEDSLPGGDYYLRAYTASQRNFDKNTWFVKPVEIISELSPYYSPSYFQTLKKIRRKQHKLQMDYAVNGHVFLKNENNFFEIRLRNYLGFPVKASVEISDMNSDKQYELETDENGMASVMLETGDAAEYKIRAKSNKSRETFRIKERAEQSVKIESYSFNDGKCRLTLFSNMPETKDKAARTFYIQYRVSGKMLRVKEVNIGNKERTEVSLDIPETGGYVDLVLTDYNADIISKESVFVPYTEPQISMDYYFEGDTVYLVSSVFSNSRVSAFITDGEDAADEAADIRDYFLYRNRIADLLNPYVGKEILTTWAKEHPNVLASGMTTPPDKEKWYAPEDNIGVSGTLYRSIFDITIPNHKVELIVLNKHYDKYETYTDEEGRFSFDKLNYKDTAKLHFITQNDRGKNAFIIDVDAESVPDFQPFYPKNIRKKIQTAKAGRKFYRNNLKYTNKKDSVAGISGKVHSRASRVLFFDEINTDGYSSTLKVIENYVIGIRSERMSTLRGYKSFMGSSEPLYLIDDVPTDKMAVDNLPPETVDRVEILMGGSDSAIYGIRATNGVVAVYTKRGHNWTPGELLLNILGYAQLQAFEYEPQQDNAAGDILAFKPAAAQTDSDTIKLAVPKTDANRNMYIDIQGFTEEGQVFRIREKLLH
jgi:hypothetical protein